MTFVRDSRQGGRRILVTGGTGFLGRPLVRRLIADGYRVRVLARSAARGEVARRLGAEVAVGDVADIDSFGRAVAGCEIAVHLAAGTSGSGKDGESATVHGTSNLMSLCATHAVKRLVYMSSCSVYGVADCPEHATVTENSPLERFPERRGAYAASKLKAERLVRDAMGPSAIPTVILRPGTIYGPGGAIFPPMMGFAVRSHYIVIGSGEFVLPLVYVDNLVDAVVMSIEKDEAVGCIFNVVDTERIDKRTYMDRVVRRIDDRARVTYVPYSLVYGMTWLQERTFKLIGRDPVLTCYRLTSSQKRVDYDSSFISTRLGWQPRVSVTDATDRVVASTLSAQFGSGEHAQVPAPSDSAS